MNEELTNDERREWARLLYTRHDNTVTDIAHTVNVDEVAVRDWISTGGWDNIKRSLLVSKATQLERFYALLEQLSARNKNVDEISAKDVDLITKYTAAIKSLESNTGIGSIVEVGEEFTNWLHRRDLAATRQFTLHFDAFIKDRYRHSS